MPRRKRRWRRPREGQKPHTKTRREAVRGRCDQYRRCGVAGTCNTAPTGKNATTRGGRRGGGGCAEQRTEGPSHTRGECAGGGGSDAGGALSVYTYRGRLEAARGGAASTAPSPAAAAPRARQAAALGQQGGGGGALRHAARGGGAGGGGLVVHDAGLRWVGLGAEVWVGVGVGVGAQSAMQLREVHRWHARRFSRR